jgi:hypothetical protein
MEEMGALAGDVERKDALWCAGVLDFEILEVARFAGLLEMPGKIASHAEADHILEIRPHDHSPCRKMTKVSSGAAV